MAAMVTEGVLPLQVALVHLMYNISGIVVMYPIPQTRIPIFAAKFFGRLTKIWRGFPVVYILFFFVLIPLVVLGISACYAADSAGYLLLGIFFTFVVVLWTAWTAYSCRYRGGWENMIECFRQRETKRLMWAELPTDLVYLKEKVALILEETGLEDTKEGEEETEESVDLKENVTKRITDDNQSEITC
jgi:solute carrier family 34 (sodium-dependent phosphate cotransporter)